MGYLDEAMAAAMRAHLRDFARRLGMPPLEPWQETVLDRVYTMRRDTGPIRVVAYVGKPVPEIEGSEIDG